MKYVIIRILSENDYYINIRKMSSRRSSAVIAMEVDSLWRKYLEAYKNYCSFPIKSLNFVIFVVNAM